MRKCPRVSHTGHLLSIWCHCLGRLRNFFGGAHPSTNPMSENTNRYETREPNRKEELLLLFFDPGKHLPSRMLPQNLRS